MAWDEFYDDKDSDMGARGGFFFYSPIGLVLTSTFFGEEIYDKIHSGYEEKPVVGKSEVFYDVKGQENHGIKEVKGNGSVVEYDLRPHFDCLYGGKTNMEFLKGAEFLVSEYYGQTGEVDSVAKKHQENLQRESRIEKALLE